MESMYEYDLRTVAQAAYTQAVEVFIIAVVLTIIWFVMLFLTCGTYVGISHIIRSIRIKKVKRKRKHDR